MINISIGPLLTLKDILAKKVCKIIALYHVFMVQTKVLQHIQIFKIAHRKATGTIFE
jgi:hypothetical protein